MGRMSKISLGTVQLGMDYGISNQLGKTKGSNAKEILQYVLDQGINVLDTAPSYGNSEDIIGDFIRNHSCDDCWRIITKTPKFKGSVIGDKQIDELFESFKLSQNKLGKENIYGLLVHECGNIFSPGGEKILDKMNQLKDSGFIKKVGVSVYSGEQIDHLLDNYAVDLVQLPINIIDHRLLNGGHLSKLKQHGVEIHARSVFLQGLLLMPLNSVHPWFNPILRVLDEFHTKAKKLNMSTLQLALGFVQSINEVDKVIIGVNTLKQMHEVINIASVRINIEEFSNLSINDSTFLDPSNWKI
jgi:aryl-alcohol dehydrogenase-like predicted oxidoreductase